MAASLLLRAARRRELASPLGTLAANAQSTVAASVRSRFGGFARTFSAKATGNEVIGTDLGTTDSCVSAMEGKEDYTDEMWAKDREKIKQMNVEFEESMKTIQKQLDAISELDRRDDEELARLKKKADRIVRVCDVITLICIPVIVVEILNIMS